ncbi:flagellar filament capping protein FliD [Sporosarcina sp. E16_8]|uniref:flagellar filament capping protein FliD n=1 Tax=Sporosarcina sp. E16_8 TaxID=2789295 RepID=UPI001A9393AB|nr:flagellar filament capping protein FliD [Sporosarcina sp. E16_8]MBO0588423.1 flagellar filament capping protein FliD [Sporosarcina sp. E16_8]
MRISGLASGMDTEKMVTDLMNAHRIPLDKITQKKQYLEWQLDDYRTTNRQLFDFSKKTFDTMILSTSFSAKTVNISSPNDVAIRNMGSTSDFSGSIKVTRLAKNATMQSAPITNKNTIPPNSNKVSDEQFAKSTLADLGITETEITINAIDKDGKMSSEAVKLIFDPKIDTLKTVLDKINKETGVTAFFDSSTGKIAMTAKNSGVDNSDTAGGKSIEIMGKLAESLGIPKSSTDGMNAEFTLNGLENMERSSNTFQVNGFEFTLKQVTADGAPPVTFSSAPDTNKIFDSVTKFVDEYNKLIEDLNKQIREPKYRDFQPLSAEQKKDMKEDEIKQWEEKAKSGTLRNDSTISSMLTQMRTALMGTVGSDTLKSLGISTSKDYTANGKLVIDEAVLKKAISDDPNKVHEMFSKDDANVDNQGFARRLRTIVDKTQTSIAQRAGKTGAVNDTFSLGRSLKEMNSQIERFEARLKTMESRYWKQFSAMETAINRANSQSASLMNAFSNN